jgi:cell shape-determining protein MreC
VLLGVAAISITQLLVSIMLAVLGIAGVWGIPRVLKGASVRSIAETAASEVARMKDFGEAQQRQIDNLKSENEHLRNQVQDLQRLVTQAAKVDELTALVKNNHSEVLKAIGARA